MTRVGSSSGSATGTAGPGARPARSGSPAPTAERQQRVRRLRGRCRARIRDTGHHAIAFLQLAANDRGHRAIGNAGPHAKELQLPVAQRPDASESATRGARRWITGRTLRTKLRPLFGSESRGKLSAFLRRELREALAAFRLPCGSSHATPLTRAGYLLR